MHKRVLAGALAALIGMGGAALAATSVSYPALAVSGGGVAVANTMTLTDASGSGETNYPLQFGRPFLQGAMPSGQCPTVLVNGAATASQADIKNRYPDGSAEFAIMAVVVPSIPASGSATLTFAPGACNNTPLTTAQMQASAYNFDANMAMVPPTGAAASFSGDAWNAATMLANGDCKPWTSGPVAQTMICADDTAARKYDIGFGDGFHPVRPRYYATFWPATHQVYVRFAPENDNIQEFEDAAYKATLTVGSTSPATVVTEDLSGTLPSPVITGLTINNAAGYPAGYTGAIAISGTPSAPMPTGTYFAIQIGAEVMQAGSYGGSTATTLYIYARNVAGLTSVGSPAFTNGEAISVSATEVKEHYAGTSWTKEAWLGGTPNPEVNVDNNLAYLDETHFTPNFDPANVMQPSAIAALYAGWLGDAHDIYDGVWDGGIWANYTGTPGARPDLGPETTWNTDWLYGGDWRMKIYAMNMADVASSWPAHLRETDPTRVGPARGGVAGGGMGLPVSLISRPGLFTVAGDMISDSDAPDGPKVTGTGFNFSINPWSGFEGSHQPNPFFIPYILTGDPFYLNEGQMWVSYDAFFPEVDTTAAWGRGPNNTYGALNDEPRGWAWTSRNRGEFAFVTPDADPLKPYFNELMNDDIARMYGALGLTGTGYDGTVMYTWGATSGWPWTNNGGPFTLKPTALKNFESNGDPVATNGVTTNSLVLQEESAGIFVPGKSGSIASTWMQWYIQYVLGRLTELGFNTKQLSLYTGQYLTGMIASAYPQTVAMYEIPSEVLGGGFYPTFAALDAAMTPAYLTGTGWNAANGNTLAQYFGTYQMYPQGYDVYVNAAMAPLVDEGAPLAAPSWAWVVSNIRTPLAALPSNFTTDPSWDIVPRTDSTVLPAQPITLQ